MPFQTRPTIQRPIPPPLAQQNRDMLLNQVIQRVNQYQQTPPLFANPVAEITNFISNPSLWFNVVGVIVGLLLIVLALNVILRKSV